MISDPIHAINERISIIDGPSGDGGERNRGYLLGKDSFAIINTGRRGSIENTFLEAIFNKGKDTKDVKFIFLTHPYPDVMGGVYKLKKIFPNAQVAINEKCKSIMDDPNNLIKENNFNFTRKEKLYFAVKKDPFDDLDAFKPDIYFKDGEKFEIDDTKLMVINFDGICEGHSMFFATAERAMFTGDALNLYPALSSSYLIDYSGSYKIWLKNIEFLEKAEISMICPAHDNYQENRHVIPYVNDVKEAFHQFENQLEMAMTEQKYLTMNQLIERVHNSQGIVWYHPYSILAPKTNMTAHLNKLIDENKVQKNEKSDPITYTYIAPRDDVFF
ncbi:MAG: MBL fold metallo-hydrolase [Candidatus Heimdallarchaeota archaeon]|nr:MBL fold metallo-hydrolase [Candidatus Heimdallarchaeota archaeon]